MALRSARAPLAKVSVRLFREDYDFLLKLFPANGAHPFIRELVHEKVSDLRARVVEGRKADVVEVVT